MSEKKFKNFINEMSIYKTTLKPQYKQYFDVIASLYLDRKIEKKSQVEKLFRKLTGRGTAAKSAISLINKYKNNKSVKGIIKGSKKRFYHIKAYIKCRIIYSKPKTKTYIETFVESKKILDFTQQQAQEEYESDLYEKYEYDYPQVSRIISIKFSISAVEKSERESERKKYKLDDMHMKKCEPKELMILPYKNNDKNLCELCGKFESTYESFGYFCDLCYNSKAIQRAEKIWMKKETKSNYDYINEYEIFNEEGISDQCVLNNFIGMYPELELTRSELITYCKRFYNPSCGLDANDDDAKKWTIEDGISARCIQELCKKYDITHYAYDAQEKCFMKHVSKNRNHKALVYYAIDNHMYLIKDKNTVKSLSEKAKSETNVNTSMLEKEKNVNRFEESEVFENIDIKNITDMQSCIIIYSRKDHSDITDIYESIIGHYNIIPNPKKVVSMNTKIIYFELKINNAKYYIYNDNNEIKLGIDWKMIRRLCDKEKIEFKNQSFTTFIKQLRTKLLDKESERKIFTEEERNEIYIRDNKACLICKKKATDFDIDHIRPLANGGTNDLNNLQVLCKTCHREKCEAEKEDGAYVRIIDSESSFNNKVKNIIESDLSKSYAFIETVKATSTQKVVTFDINKCRTNILYQSKYDYPVFTVMDNVCDYDGQKNPGLYYIESSNIFPLRGNGWYYYPIVDYCLKNNIVKSADIKYCVISSLTIPHNYYNEFIEYCRKELDDKTCKFAINSMIGCFMMNTSKNSISTLLHVCKDSKEAFSYYYNYNGSLVNNFEVNNENYFSVYKTNDSMKIETESPIYNQIVQLEAIELHKLTLLIKDNNGEVLDLNTDAVTCGYDGDIKKIVCTKYPDGSLMYKTEKKKRLEKPKMSKLLRTNTYSNYDHQYNIYNDVEDNDFKPLVDKILDSKKSVHIDGCAGAGKSTLIKMLQKEMNARELRYKSTAPTNKACNIIDGITLHKFATEISKKSYIKNMDLDYIFVDEISMVKEIFYKFLLMIKAVKPNIIFIISGDFRQLAPVNDRINVNYKKSIALHELCDGNRLQLNKCRRADNEMYELCSASNIPKVEQHQFSKNYCDFNICFTNKKRKEINDKLMKDKYKSRKPKKGKFLKLDKYYFDDNSQDVILMSNTPLISRKTDGERGLIKNEFYSIKKIDGDKIILNNDFVFTDNIQFQKYFYVSYAITTHKAQGCTFDFDYTIYEWSKMDNRLKYVALSRATNKNLINII